MGVGEGHGLVSGVAKAVEELVELKEDEERGGGEDTCVLNEGVGLVVICL